MPLPDQLMSYLHRTLTESDLLETLVVHMVEPIAILDERLYLKAYNQAFLAQLGIEGWPDTVPVLELMPTLQAHLHPQAPHLRGHFTLLYAPQAGQGAVHIHVQAYPFAGGESSQGGYVLLLKDPPPDDDLYQQIRQLGRIVEGLRAQFVQLSSSEIDQGIDEMLRQLGEFFQVDRSYVFQEDRHQRGHINNTHEWCAAGIEPQRDFLQRVPLDEEFTWAGQMMRQGRVINYTDLHELPPEAASFRMILEAQDIQSVLLVPFRCDDELVGFIGFDAVQQPRRWTREVERLLRLLGEVLGPALQRQRAGQQLSVINQRYRDIVSLTTDFIFLLRLSPEGEIEIEWASGNLEPFRDMMPQSKVPQQNVFDAVHPEDRDRIRRGMETLSRGEVLHERMRLRWPDGSLRWIESISNPTLDEAGRLTAILSSVRDITDLRLAEQRVATQERYLETVLETIPMAVSLQDGRGHWLYANRPMHELYQLPRRYQGKATADLLPASRAMFAEWEEATSRQAVQHLGPRCMAEQEYSLVDERGQTRYFVVTRLHLQDEQGVDEFIVTVCQDITLRHESEQRTQTLATVLMQRNAELQQFAYITSHNLRAPVMNLVSLMGFYDRERPETPANESIVEKIDQSVQRLHETLNDLLDIVDIKDPERPRASWQRVEDAYQYVSQSIGEQLLRSEAVVQTDFAVEDVYFSGAYLKSILLNLLTNAIKYRSPACPLRVRLRTYREPGWVIMEVADNGLGIDLAKNGHRLFRMYERLQEEGDGKGLGLYMVRSQIEAFGGKVHVESVLNSGTTFYIYFPDQISTSS